MSEPELSSEQIMVLLREAADLVKDDDNEAWMVLVAAAVARDHGTPLPPVDEERVILLAEVVIEVKGQ